LPELAVPEQQQVSCWQVLTLVLSVVQLESELQRAQVSRAQQVQPLARLAARVAAPLVLQVVSQLGPERVLLELALQVQSVRLVPLAS
jgi:hypothetical protein